METFENSEFACRQPWLGRDLKIAVLLSIVYALLALPWVYRTGTGEPDAIAACVGISQALHGGQLMRGEWLYFPVGQPLYYAMAFALPGAGHFSLEGIFLGLNHLSWLASALTSGIMYLVFRRFASVQASLLGVCAIFASQTVFAMSLHTHPITLAIFLLAIGILVFGVACEQLCRCVQLRCLVFCASIMIFAMAVAMRADVMALFPAALVLCILISNRSRMQIGAAFLVTGLGALGGLLMINALTPASLGVAAQSGGPLSSLRALAATLRQFNENSGLFVYVNGLAETLINSGPLTFVGVAIAGAFAVKQNRWAAIACALAVFLPPLFIASGNPSGSRRWLQIVYALGICLPILYPHLHVRKWLIAVLALASIAANFVLFPYAVKLLPDSEGLLSRHSVLKRLSRSIVRHTAENKRYIRWERTAMPGLVETLSTGTLVVGGFGHLNNIVGQFDRAGKLVHHSAIRQAPGMNLLRVDVDNASFSFLEWTLAADCEMPVLDKEKIVYLYAYPGEKAGKLPPGTTLTPPDGSAFFAW